MANIPLFHLAFPVDSLAEARAFYGELLGCPEGRSSDAWVDFDFYGHQIVAHLSPGEARSAKTSEVDDHAVPVRHFGAILSMEQWDTLADKLRAAGTKFVIEPMCASRAKWANRLLCSLWIPRATHSNSRLSAT